MRIFTKLLTVSAALAAAAPAAAQYYSNPYSGYAQSYGYAQPYAVNTSVAEQQCTAAVQNRLYNRRGVGGILGSILGTNTSGRVVAVTRVTASSNGMIRVRGLASSGRMA